MDSEDLVPIGPDGEPIDVEKIVEKYGLVEYPSLAYVFTAIVAAHPTSRSTPKTRLERMLKDSIGISRKRGVAKANDYPVLLEIARRHHQATVGNGYGRVGARREGKFELPEYLRAPLDRPLKESTERAPSVTHIIRTLLKSFPVGHRLNPKAGIENSIRRLQRKYVEQQSVLLARIDAERDPYMQEPIRKMRAALRALENIGVKVLPPAYPTRLCLNMNGR